MMTTATWGNMRLRYVCKVNPNRGKKDYLPSDTEVSFVPMENIGEYGSLSLDKTKKIDEVSSGYTYFENHDVVFAKITPCFENGKGAIADKLLNEIAFGSTELHVLRPYNDIILSKFLYYLTISDYFRKNGESFMYGAGGQKRVPEDFVKDYVFRLLPISIQKVIIAYLDKETARIDELIAKKERQIALLKEKRQAIITHAVTKGLDPKAKMVDSGVEWIGEIPERWEVKKMKYLGKAIIGLTYSPEDVVSDDDNIEKYLVLRSSNIQQGRLDLEDTVYVTKNIAKELSVQKGDILICARNGSRNLVGKNALIDHEFTNVTFGAFMTVFRSGINNYLCHYLSSSIFQYQATGFLTTTINQLTNDILNNILVIVPPKEERSSLAFFLNAQKQVYDEQEELILKSILLLREYRSSLITSAVSGQIDITKMEAAG